MCRLSMGLSQPRTRFPSDSRLLYQKSLNRVKGKKSPSGDFLVQVKTNGRIRLRYRLIAIGRARTRRGTPRRGRDGLTPSQGKALAQSRRSHGTASR